MSLSDKINEVFAENPEIRTALEKICLWVLHEYGQNLWICSLHGKRWSFFAGSSWTPEGGLRYDLNRDWGIVTDRQSIPYDKWQSLCKELNRKLTPAV